MNDDTTLATAWLRGLAARGVSVALRNGRLAYRPANAYKGLTDAELLTLRHHRAAIIALVKTGFQLEVQHATVNAEPQAAPAEPASPCTWCGRAPCIGEAHEHFATLHPHHQPPPRYDLAELRRSNEGLRVVP